MSRTTRRNAGRWPDRAYLAAVVAWVVALSPVIVLALAVAGVVSLVRRVSGRIEGAQALATGEAGDGSEGR